MVKISNKLKVSIVALCLLSVLLGAYIGYSATPPSTFYLSSGVYPGAPSYTIWREGGNYFAKDPNGLIVFSGSNPSAVINACIQSMDSNTEGYLGGKIFLRNGQYDLTTPIVIDRFNIQIEGEGRATELRATIENMTLVQMYGENLHDIRIANLIFYNPNWQTWRNATGIFIDTVHEGIESNIIYNVVLENLNFLELNGITTPISGYAGNYTHHHLIHSEFHKCVFYNCPHYGIRLFNALDVVITENYMDFGVDRERSGTVGINITARPGGESLGHQIYSTRILYPEYGIFIKDGFEGWFDQVITDLCINYGVYLKNANRSEWNGLYASTNATADSYGLYLDNSYLNRFLGCTFYNCHYGARSCTGTASLYNVFSGTISMGNTEDWYNIYDYDKFSACNYKIQNAGFFVCNNGTWIEHGLAGTPDVIQLTLTGANGYAWVGDKNTTKFQVYGSIPTDMNGYFYACMSEHLP